jgi:hypothetical protein
METANMQCQQFNVVYQRMVRGNLIYRATQHYVTQVNTANIKASTNNTFIPGLTQIRVYMLPLDRMCYLI